MERIMKKPQLVNELAARTEIFKKDVREIVNALEDIIQEQFQTAEFGANSELHLAPGVVLVGTIKKDNTGWYFAPEQPLNITLTYYIDNPEYFENVIGEHIPERTPFVGKNFNVTRAGIHADGLLKNDKGSKFKVFIK